MNPNLQMKDVTQVLASIRDTVSEANAAFDHGGDTGWRIQSAFVKMKVLLETMGLVEALKDIQQVETEAKDKYGEVSFDDETGTEFLLWGGRLYQHILALESVFGEPRASLVTKDVIQILRATQYSITDRNCFANPPTNENEVHSRVEAVLRCVFPDLLHKPPIAKQIKNFQPDTGLPSIGTLIEYKFVGRQGEERRIADEILADTRGYLSKEWNNYIYVIYETKRIKPEAQWRQLLRSSGLKSNTEVVVISGEEPRRKTRPRTIPQEVKQAKA